MGTQERYEELSSMVTEEQSVAEIMEQTRLYYELHPEELEGRSGTEMDITSIQVD